MAWACCARCGPTLALPKSPYSSSPPTPKNPARRQPAKPAPPAGSTSRLTSTCCTKSSTPCWLEPRNTKMSDALDLRQFYETFFEEADELLAEMERLLLDINVDDPDPEHLHAIFRAAHSIKGGAATFGFVALTETTHLLENLLDAIRRGEMTLRADMIDIFLETKDV